MHRPKILRLLQGVDRTSHPSDPEALAEPAEVGVDGDARQAMSALVSDSLPARTGSNAFQSD